MYDYGNAFNENDDRIPNQDDIFDEDEEIILDQDDIFFEDEDIVESDEDEDDYEVEEVTGVLKF